MIYRSQFVRKCRQYGAVYLLAPETVSSELENLGTLSISKAELKNGATLATPGLVSGGAVAALDGTNDYIETAWRTRTNLMTNPSIEVDLTDWFHDGTNVEYINWERSVAWTADGTASLYVKARCTVAGGRVRAWSRNGGTTTGYLVTAGNKYAISCQVNVATLPANGPGIYVRWMKADGVTTISDSFTRSSMATSRGVQSISAVYTAPAEAASCHIMIGHYNQGNELALNEITEYSIDTVLLEEAETVGSYFPTVAQLASGEAGWSGTAHRSSSQLGVFANGTSRTFAGIASRANSSTRDTILGSSSTTARTWVQLRIGEGSQDVVFTVDGDANRVAWSGAWPGNEQTVAWGLTFNETTNIAELFINGVSKGTRELTQAYATLPGSLQLGTTGNGTGNPLAGQMLPFAVFFKTLSRIEIEELISEALTSVSVSKSAIAIPSFEWRIFLAKSSNLENIAELTTIARNKNLTLALNKSGSMSFDMPLDSSITREVDVISRCIKAVKNETTVWSGPIWTLNESLPDNKLQVNAAGWFELLRKRFWLERSEQFSETNMGTLMFKNLAAANRQFTTWITEGSNSATGRITRQWERYDNIGDAIEGISQIENGPDFKVDPVTRALNIAQSEMTDQTNVIFGYNSGPSNVQEVRRTKDADVMANYIVATGMNTSGASAESVTAQEAYQMFQRIDSLNSVVSLEVLAAYVNAEIAVCKLPRTLYSFTPFPSNGSNGVPSIFEDYDIGDKVYLSVNWPPRFEVYKQAVRVFGTSISIDEEGNETVGEIQTTFS